MVNVPIWPSPMNPHVASRCWVVENVRDGDARNVRRGRYGAGRRCAAPVRDDVSRTFIIGKLKMNRMIEVACMTVLELRRKK